MKSYQTSFIEDYKIGSLEKKEEKVIIQKKKREKRKEALKELKLIKEKEIKLEQDKNHVGDLFE